MSLQSLTITCRDHQWHDAFIDYVPKVFPRASFRRWHELGGWDEDYVAFSIADGADIVANASLQRMNIVLRGEWITGWQLGAVGVVPQWRGRGLQRQIMQSLLGSIDEKDIVFLFANDTVLDFYPLFGFRRVIESVYAAEYNVKPASEPLRALSIDRAEDLALLARVAAAAAPTTREFGARNYGGVLLWYWANFYDGCFYYCEAEDAIIVAELDGATLRLCDVLARTSFDLRSYLPRVAKDAAQRVEFGFTPDVWWPDARVVADYTDSPLFVRGAHRLPQAPFKFPMLAQT
jgi:ribosomal protein S18 acetylase RimI-like enzyme